MKRQPSACWLVLVAAFMFWLATAPRALAQASLASEDEIDEVPVNVDGVKEAFSVFRDAVQRDQFYYIPNSPRLYERSVNGKNEPEFVLVRYQFPDPANPQALLEGGVMAFSASLAAPADALDQMKARVRQSFANVSNNLRLSAMPLKSASVSLLAAKNPSFVTSQQGAGIAPVIASQKMAFMLELTDKGADLFDAMAKGDDGPVQVVVGFTYMGLTPPAGFTVHVDWDQTYKFYSKDQEFAARASYLGLVSANAKVSKQDISDKLISNKCISVKGRTGEGFTQQELDTYLQPILQRINTEIVDAMKPPTAIDPAKASEPDTAGKFGGAGYSVAIKDATKVKHGSEDISYQFQQLVERTTIASGPIGISKYAKDADLMKRLVIAAAPGFKSAYFMLPPVGDQLGITQVDLELSLQNGNKNYLTTTAEWNAKDGWAYKGQHAAVVPMPLTALPAEIAGKPVEDMKFYTETRILLGSGQYFISKQTSDVFNGRKSVAPPTSNIDVVQVNGSVLPWKMINPTDKLVEAAVTLRSGDRTYTGHLQAKRENGQYTEPDPLIFFFEKPAWPAKPEPIAATVTYKFIGRPPLVQTTPDLRDPAIGLSLWLDPTTWPDSGAPRP